MNKKLHSAHFKKQYLLFAIAIIILANFSRIDAQTKMYGDSTSFGGGMIKSWIEVDAGNNPQRVGITITKSILSNLPSGYRDISLNLPAAADSLFKHIFINWNPGGHPPQTVYGLPHFDMHYYIITNAERQQIQGGIHNVPVASEFIPEDYIFTPGEEYVSVPQMGVHYVDSLSHEFHGQTFTRTFIYGFYEGAMIFVEPMITVDYLATVVNEVIPVKLPQFYQKTGYYPTTYEVNFDSTAGTIDVIIKDLVYRSAVTSVENSEYIPDKLLLQQNYPNPFNPATTIKYSIPALFNVSLKVFNSLGEELETLVNEEKPAGNYEITWNAKNHANGIYFYRIQAGNFIETKKMILMK